MPRALHQSPFFSFVRHANGLQMPMMSFHLYVFLIFDVSSGIILYCLFLRWIGEEGFTYFVRFALLFSSSMPSPSLLDLFSEKFQ